MDLTKDSCLRGNHPALPLSLPSPLFSPGDDPPILFSALLQCPVASGMPESENLLSLASVRPRDLGLPLVHHLQPGSLASHNQTPTWGSVENILQSSAFSRPEYRNSGGVSSFYCPMPTAQKNIAGLIFRQNYLQILEEPPD